MKAKKAKKAKPLEFLWAKTVVTRKDHHCWGCLNVYPRGSRLLSESFAENHKAYHLYTCPDCNQFLEKYEDKVYGLDPQFEEKGLPEGSLNKLKQQFEWKPAAASKTVRA